jgi:hypothetical protein
MLDYVNTDIIICLLTKLGICFALHIRNLQKGKVKVKLSLYRSWRPLGLREVEAPTFLDIHFTDGFKVVSPTRRPLFTPRKFPSTHFC